MCCLLFLLGWLSQQDHRSILCWSWPGVLGAHGPWAAVALVCPGAGHKDSDPRALCQAVLPPQDKFPDLFLWLFPPFLPLIPLDGYSSQGMTNQSGLEPSSLFAAVELPSQPHALFLAWNERKAFSARCRVDWLTFIFSWCMTRWGRACDKASCSEKSLQIQLGCSQDAQKGAHGQNSLRKTRLPCFFA